MPRLALVDDARPPPASVMSDPALPRSVPRFTELYEAHVDAVPTS